MRECQLLLNNHRSYLSKKRFCGSENDAVCTHKIKNRQFNIYNSHYNFTSNYNILKFSLCKNLLKSLLCNITVGFRLMECMIM